MHNPCHPNPGLLPFCPNPSPALHGILSSTCVRPQLRTLNLSPEACRLLALQPGGAAFLYDAIECITTAVPNVSSQCTGAIWDACDPRTFLLTNFDGELRIYAYEGRPADRGS